MPINANPTVPEALNPLERVIGQPLVRTLLERAIRLKQIAPAYLFAGLDGVGKRLMAQCFCQAVTKGAPEASAGAVNLINHPDVLWLEPTYLYQNELLPASLASENGLEFKSPPQVRIEQIREVTQFLSRRPLKCERLVVVIEAVHTMTSAAANAFLKTLEEPGQATSILITSNPDQLLPTILSRCQQIPFHLLSADHSRQVLEHSGYQEILSHPEIWEMAQGSPGQVIAHWKKFQSLPPELLNVPTALSVSQQLTLAQKIAQSLSLDEQLWLADYWQRQLWRQTLNPTSLQVFGQTQSALSKHVQPQLVWEVCLANLN